MKDELIKKPDSIHFSGSFVQIYYTYIRIIFCHSVVVLTRVHLDRIPLANPCSTTDHSQVLCYHIIDFFLAWGANFQKNKDDLINNRSFSFDYSYYLFCFLCFFHFVQLLYVCWPLDCLICTQTLAGLAIYKNLQRQITARVWREPN